MKHVRRHLEKLRAIKRKHYHPLIHKIHKKHKISKKTLFYVKEYGPHTNVSKTILKESIKILILASIISSLGGLAIENIKTIFIPLIPLVILLPSLNSLVGSYGVIISSHFSTMLHEGKVREKWWKNKEIRKLSAQILIISIITTLISSSLALSISVFSNYNLTVSSVSKVFLITILDVVIIVSIILFVSIYAGLHFYKKKEDPNNFLIPITTSIADFGNMILLSGLILLLF